jgi:hypothetical protein
MIANVQGLEGRVVDVVSSKHPPYLLVHDRMRHTLQTIHAAFMDSAGSAQSTPTQETAQIIIMTVDAMFIYSNSGVGLLPSGDFYLKSIGVGFRRQVARDHWLQYRLEELLPVYKKVNGCTVEMEHWHVTLVDLTLRQRRLHCQAACCALLKLSTPELPWKDVRKMIARELYKTKRHSVWNDSDADAPTIQVKARKLGEDA